MPIQGNQSPSFWYKLVHLQPALWHGLVVAIFALLASVGVVVSPDIPDNLVAVIIAVAALVQALWTRSVVVPEDKVVAYVEKPWSGEQLKAGPAAPSPATSKALVDSAVYQKAA